MELKLASERKQKLQRQKELDDRESELTNLKETLTSSKDAQLASRLHETEGSHRTVKEDLDKSKTELYASKVIVTISDDLLLEIWAIINCVFFEDGTRSSDATVPG